jgi:hypothetical protein
MAVPTPCWGVDDYKDIIPPYGLVKNYVDYASQCTDAPPGYHVVSILGFIANAIAAEHDLSVDGEIIHLHNFHLIVGESGNRKSAALKRAERIVRPCYQLAKLSKRIWFPESSTPEGIMEALGDDPNRIMLLSEWSELVSQGKAQYWQHTPQFFELLYDRIPVKRLKMRKPVDIERPCMTILGASTPSLVKQHTSLNDWEGGKMARYLIYCMNKPADKEMVNAVEHAELIEDLRRKFDLLLSPSLVQLFTVSPEAKEYKDDWQASYAWKDFVTRFPTHLKASALRAGEHAYRVATAYQASMDYPGGSMVVGLDAMEAAVTFVATCMQSTLDTFGILPVHGKEPLVRLRLLLAMAGFDGIERKELLRRSQLTTGTFTVALNTMLDCDEVTFVKKGVGNTQYVCPTRLRRET